VGPALGLVKIATAQQAPPALASVLVLVLVLVQVRWH